VSTASYFPYCFFNILSPILDVVYGFLGFKTPTLAEAADRQRAVEVETAPVARA
jgi:Na+/H+ antiporter NhaC